MNWIACCLVIFLLLIGMGIGLFMGFIPEAYVTSKKEEDMFTKTTSDTYTLELTRDSIRHRWLFDTPGRVKEFANSCIEQFNRVLKLKQEILTFSYIRAELGFEPIRAEYEMCYGPDPNKPISVIVVDNEDPQNTVVKLIFSDIVDLRQYRELD